MAELEIYALDPTNQPTTKTVGGVGSWDSGSLLQFTIPNARALCVGLMVSGKFAFVDGDGKVIEMNDEFSAAGKPSYGGIMDFAAAIGNFGLFNHISVSRALTSNVLDDVSQAPQVATFIAQRHGVDWLSKSTGNMACPAFQDQSYSSSHGVGAYGAFRPFGFNPLSPLLNASPIPLGPDGVNGITLDLTIARFSDSGNTTWTWDSLFVASDDDALTTIPMRDPISTQLIPQNFTNVTIRIVDPKLWVVMDASNYAARAAAAFSSFVFTRVSIQRTPMNYNSNQFFTSPISNSYVKSIFYQIMDQDLQKDSGYYRFSPCAFAYNDLKLFFNGRPQVFKIPSNAQPLNAQMSPYVPNAFVMAAFYTPTAPSNWRKTAMGSMAIFTYDPDGNGQYFDNIQVQFQMLLKALVAPGYPFNDWSGKWNEVRNPFAITGNAFATYRANNVSDDNDYPIFLKPQGCRPELYQTALASYPGSKYMRPIAPDQRKDLLIISEQIATLVINQSSEIVVEEAPKVPGIPPFLHTNRAAGTSAVVRVQPMRIPMNVLYGQKPNIHAIQGLLPPSGKPGTMMLNFYATPKYLYGTSGRGYAALIIQGGDEIEASDLPVPGDSKGYIGLFPADDPTNASAYQSAYIALSTNLLETNGGWVRATADNLLANPRKYLCDPRHILVNTLALPCITGVSEWFKNVKLSLPQGQLLENNDIAYTKFLFKYSDPSQLDADNGRWVSHSTNAWAVDSVQEQRYSDLLLARQDNTCFSEWDSVYPCFDPSNQELSDYYTYVPPYTCVDMTYVSPFFTQFKNAMYVSSGATKQFLTLELNKWLDGLANCPAGAGYGHTCEPDFPRTLMSSTTEGGLYRLANAPRRNAIEWTYDNTSYPAFLTADCIFYDSNTQLSLDTAFRMHGISITIPSFNFTHRFFNVLPPVTYGGPTVSTMRMGYDEIAANPPYAVGGRDPKIMLLIHQYMQLVEDTLCLVSKPWEAEDYIERDADNLQDGPFHFYGDTIRNPPYVGMRDGIHASFPAACTDRNANLAWLQYETIPLFDAFADGQPIYKYRIGSCIVNQVHEAVLHRFPCQRPQWEKYYGMHHRNVIYDSHPWCYFNEWDLCLLPDADLGYQNNIFVGEEEDYDADKVYYSTYARKGWAWSNILPTRYIVPFEIEESFRRMNLFSLSSDSINTNFPNGPPLCPYPNWFDGSCHFKTYDLPAFMKGNMNKNEYIKALLQPMCYVRTLAELQHVVVKFNDCTSSVTMDYPSGLKL